MSHNKNKKLHISNIDVVKGRAKPLSDAEEACLSLALDDKYVDIHTATMLIRKHNLILDRENYTWSTCGGICMLKLERDVTDTVRYKSIARLSVADEGIVITRKDLVCLAKSNNSGYILLNTKRLVSGILHIDYYGNLTLYPLQDRYCGAGHKLSLAQLKFL